MSDYRKNCEGYPDPTAAIAIQRADRKPGRRYMPMTYICSRYAGNVERNRSDAIRFCRFAIEKGFMPVASHLLYPQILSDDIADERTLGLRFGTLLLDRCEEVWVFTDGTLSPGMEMEVRRAKKRRMKIRYFDLSCAEREAVP